MSICAFRFTTDQPRIKSVYETSITNMVKFRHDKDLYVFWRNAYKSADEKLKECEK